MNNETVALHSPIRLTKSTKVLAYADVVAGEDNYNELTVRTGKYGLFVAVPYQKPFPDKKTGENIFKPYYRISKDRWEKISHVVLEAYEARKAA